jgi:hypothetical protein
MATWVAYNSAKARQWNGNALDFDTGATLKVALVTASYTPAPTTHDFWDDAVANEVTGSNYTAGGIALGTKTVTVTGTVCTFAAAEITWLQHATGFSTARCAILYNDTGTASTSALVAYADLTVDRGNVTGDLTLQFPTGLLKC